MAAVVVPVGKIVYVCDDVLGDPASGKVHALGIFNAIRTDGPGAFPFRLGRLCVFAQLTGGTGQIPARVDVVHGRTQDVVFSSQEVLLNFLDKQTEVAFCFRILGARFPEPGTYFVELYCGRRFIDDRLVRVLS